MKIYYINRALVILNRTALYLIILSGWQVQTIGFSLLTLKSLEQPYIEKFESIPKEVTTIIGLILTISGLGSKCAAIYYTGYNTYYWYDMVLNTPNAYFIEGGIYKYCGSPTYTLGRMTGFGASIHFRSRMPQGKINFNNFSSPVLEICGSITLILQKIFHYIHTQAEITFSPRDRKFISLFHLWDRRTFITFPPRD